jgi:hypothetical protein
VCEAIATLAELEVEMSEAMGDDWDRALEVISENLDATDEAYRTIVEDGDVALRSAAEDLLAFDDRVRSSGALEAPGPDEFAAALDGLPGSAEAGAADAVLREHARTECGVDEPD